MKYREHEEPLYFIKMINIGTDEKGIDFREIYYMALAGD
jgi:hypothetical protein